MCDERVSNLESAATENLYRITYHATSTVIDDPCYVLQDI